MRNSASFPSEAEQYLSTLFARDHLIDPSFSELLADSRKMSNLLNKTEISVSENEARILSTLVASHACKKFVEIGTLTAYSALWILRGLPEGGELFTFEKQDSHARQALEVFNRFHQLADQGALGFRGKRAHLYEGDAEENLKIIEEQGPFDGIFIDGNKSAYGRYLDWAESNLKKGGIIVADNVFLKGAVWQQGLGHTNSVFSEKQIHVMQEFNQRLAESKRYQSVILPTVEGLFFAIKKF